MADGRHGDHTISQILSVQGIRRFGNGTKVSETDEIRGVREIVVKISLRKMATQYSTCTSKVTKEIRWR